MAKKNRSQHDSDDFPIDPVPRTSIWNLLLCVLNVVAAAAFIYLLQIDLEKRRAMTRACFLLDVTIQGTPLAREDKGPAGVVETDAKPVLRSDELKTALTDRKAGGGTPKEPLVAQDVMPPPRITPSDLDADKQQAIFGGKYPITTLEAEMVRVREIILKDIKKAADEAAKVDFVPADKKAELLEKFKDNEADLARALEEVRIDYKRQALRKVLLPQAVDSFQVLELDKMVRAADEGKLDDLLVAAYERRIILDILKPIEYHRWGDPKRPYLNLINTTDVSGLNVEELRTKLARRLKDATEDNYDGEFFRGEKWNGQQREAVEKRDNIAALLFTIAHVRKPDDKLLYEQGAERTQTVLGLYAFAAAAKEFTTAMDNMTKRLIQQIENDREGIVVKIVKNAARNEFKDTVDKLKAENVDGQFKDIVKKIDDKSLEQSTDKLPLLERIEKTYDIPGDGNDTFRTEAFTTRYKESIDRIGRLIAAINRVELSLALKQKQQREAKNTYETGQKEVAAMEEELLKERVKTGKLLVELQAIQARLFRSQRELATAAEDNQNLARQIREVEQERLRFEGLLPAKGKEP